MQKDWASFKEYLIWKASKDALLFGWAAPARLKLYTYDIDLGIAKSYMPVLMIPASERIARYLMRPPLKHPANEGNL